MRTPTAEELRLGQNARRERNWQRWGPYLAERQWGTVREDYSADGDAWRYFTHEQARSRTYRWGEDGLLGICDRQCRLCFSLALWNERDAILKERLFGLTGPEGNHGEDVKECYYYLDSTPTHAYMKALYKYPQRAFPYEQLLEVNHQRGFGEPEFELLDTGVFDDDRYFDVFVEYAKSDPDDLLIRIIACNRSEHAARLHLLPTLWFRNTWAWGRHTEDYLAEPPVLEAENERAIRAEHPTLGRLLLVAGDHPDSGAPPSLLFSRNETNTQLLYGEPLAQPYVKDAFHRYVVAGERGAIDPRQSGTKAAVHYAVEIGPGASQVFRLRLSAERDLLPNPLGTNFSETFQRRRREADAFYRATLDPDLSDDERAVTRQAYAGLLWSKQFYHYVVKDWLEGDPTQPSPPAARETGRNHRWVNHLYNRDVISMPDKWEYPWYAAWDLAFHMLPFAEIDPSFAKQQLVLFLREWYMHPNGQLPAYEFALSDVNPPVHAWAAWRIYKMTGGKIPGVGEQRDRQFLSHVFQKLLMNFTWWVNQKDTDGNNIFSGGFLGLDNIGVFDRSKPLPVDGRLEQADGTAWMAFYCGEMLAMALELARFDPAGEDLASKFFEHFVAIADSVNCLGGSGLWDEEDGFYYDALQIDGRTVPLRVRSMVGLIPLFATEVLDRSTLDDLPGFRKRMRWFRENRPEVAEGILSSDDGKLLLSLVPRERLLRVLGRLLDEQEFLSPHGIRSVSRAHAREPYVFSLDGHEHRVAYNPGESDSWMFGGNSNWRGPVWFPLNYLLIEALERFHHFDPQLRVACPTGSDNMLSLQQVADELANRLGRLMLRGPDGARPVHGAQARYRDDPHWRDLVLFYEYFHGDHGKGLGASHQTGWTALVARCLEHRARARRSGRSG